MNVIDRVNEINDEDEGIIDYVVMHPDDFDELQKSGESILTIRIPIYTNKYVERGTIVRSMRKSPDLKRPYLNEDGSITFISLNECKCKNQRGPENGVCGNCGNAISGG
jgi:hypothetical protein